MFDIDTYWYPPNASPLDIQEYEDIDAARQQAEDDGTEVCMLYRYFDVHARLLYVGITATPRKRLMGHRRDSEFWRFANCSTTYVYPSSRAAREAETAAIKNEYPVFNIHGRPRELGARLVEQYLDDLDQRLGSRV